MIYDKMRDTPSEVRTLAEGAVQKFLAPTANDTFKERLHWLVVDAIMEDRKANPRVAAKPNPILDKGGEE